MDTSIGYQLEQKQNITLTPKLMEELKILQMPGMELEHYIDEALIDNPMLEADKENDLINVFVKSINDSTTNEEDINSGGASIEKDFAEYTPTIISLRQHLHSQLRELEMNKHQRMLIEYLIENIADDGYLIVNIKEAALDLNVSVEKVKKALYIIQQLDPCGVGARNLKECILLQLKGKKLLAKYIRDVVIYCLEPLSKRKYKEIAKSLKLSEEKVLEAHRVIKQVNPKPGYSYCNMSASFIVPELIVKEMNGEYFVLFNEERVPSLRINKFYSEFLTKDNKNSQEHRYLKSRLDKALGLIKAIEQRKKTILSTGSFIVQFQKEFFRKGYTYFRPLTLKMAADTIGVHESTISRTVNGKYMQTPRGIFELKYFFTSKVEQENGFDISANSIKELISKIITKEDKKTPLSDEQIRKELDRRGIKVARRTIAKYREELSILPAFMRK